MKITTVAELRSHSIATESGCWEWAHSVWGSGYGRVVDDGRALRAHRIAYEVAHAPLPAHALVLHSCDNRRCVNPAHLRIGTHSENMRDRSERKRTAVGERCHQSKLTEAAVIEIRARFEAGAKVADLAREYGVSYQSLGSVVTRSSWRHI